MTSADFSGGGEGGGQASDEDPHVRQVKSWPKVTRSGHGGGRNWKQVCWSQTLRSCCMCGPGWDRAWLGQKQQRAGREPGLRANRLGSKPVPPLRTPMSCVWSGELLRLSEFGSFVPLGCASCPLSSSKGKAVTRVSLSHILWKVFLANLPPEMLWELDNTRDAQHLAWCLPRRNRPRRESPVPVAMGTQSQAAVPRLAQRLARGER